MADQQQVITASTLLHTGKGQLMGLLVTSTAGAPKLTAYDGTNNTGTKIYEATVSYIGGVQVFFPEDFAPFFSAGLYLELAANLTAVVWWREISYPPAA